MQTTDRYDKALLFASGVHRKQRRKATETPYVAHLLSVSALVLEYGGDEDVAIAALLHDAIEDQNVTQEVIAAAFNKKVADIVEACSHAKIDWNKVPTAEVQPKLTTQRQTYFEHLKKADPNVRLVSACDKLHNLRSILQDIQKAALEGHGLRAVQFVLDRFRGGVDGTLWYYTELAKIFSKHGPTPIGAELTMGCERLRTCVDNAKAAGLAA